MAFIQADSLGYVTIKANSELSNYP